MANSLTYILLTCIISLLYGQIEKKIERPLISISVYGKNICIKIDDRYQNHTISLELRCYNMLTSCVLDKVSFLRYPQIEDCIELPISSQGMYFIYIKTQFPFDSDRDKYVIVKKVIINP